MSGDKLTGQQIADEELTGWANLLGGLQTRIRTPDFATGLRIVNAVGAAAEQMDHHPDIDLRYANVDIRLTSHDAAGITARDIALARAIASIARDAGVGLDCSSVSRIELALDSPSHQAILPFWRAALALADPVDAGTDDELRDPYGVLPVIWFQESGGDEPRQRWHPDVWVDPGQVRPRIELAIAAGGTLVSDENAPSFWVLADPEGNKVCLCTWQERG